MGVLGGSGFVVCLFLGVCVLFVRGGCLGGYVFREVCRYVVGVWCQTRCIEGWGVCAMGATGVCGLGWLYGG